MGKTGATIKIHLLYPNVCAIIKQTIGRCIMEQNIRPVDVISVCTAAGEIRPLRMQLVDEERQLLRINIEEVVKTEEITHVGAEAAVFTCRATVWDRKWLFELR